MPNKHFTLSFQADFKVNEDIEYLVRELNHENLSNGSMLKTNKSEVLRRIVSAGLKTELGRLRQRKIAELDQLVGNTPNSVALQNRDIQVVPETVSQARYKQAKEAYSNDGCK
tara:strand:- start:2143 stop:2481 length:339 start_codon:yes stop_codon:yes gene_type:complete